VGSEGIEPLDGHPNVFRHLIYSQAWGTEPLFS
jgi:hypothetical protein